MLALAHTQEVEAIDPHVVKEGDQWLQAPFQRMQDGPQGTATVQRGVDRRVDGGQRGGWKVGELGRL